MGGSSRFNCWEVAEEFVTFDDETDRVKNSSSSNKAFDYRQPVDLALSDDERFLAVANQKTGDLSMLQIASKAHPATPSVQEFDRFAVHVEGAIGRLESGRGPNVLSEVGARRDRVATDYHDFIGPGSS